MGPMLSSVTPGHDGICCPRGALEGTPGTMPAEKCATGMRGDRCPLGNAISRVDIVSVSVEYHGPFLGRTCMHGVTCHHRNPARATSLIVRWYGGL